MQIEMYYGYYAGDSQVWDTEYVEIPDNTHEFVIEKVAKAEFQKVAEEWAKKSNFFTLAFYGIYHIEDDDNG